MLLFLKHLLQLMFAPHTGWIDLSHADKPTSFWLQKGFYPLLAITALSCFMSGVYHEGVTVAEMLQSAMTVFIAFFTTYFLAGFLFGMILDRLAELPDSSEMTRDGVMGRYNTVTVFVLSLMALLTLIENLLPFDLTITKFLYLYILFIIYRASDFIGIPADKSGLFTLIECLIVFLPPFAIIEWLSSLF